MTLKHRKTATVNLKSTIVDTSEIAKATYKTTWGLGFFLAPIASGVSIGMGASFEVALLFGALAFSVGVNVKQKVKPKVKARHHTNGAID